MKFEATVANGSEGKFHPYNVEGANVAEAAGKAVAEHLVRREYGNPEMTGAEINITIHIKKAK